MASTVRGKISGSKIISDDLGNFLSARNETRSEEVKQIRLGLWFMMSKGVVLAALANFLKYK